MYHIALTQSLSDEGMEYLKKFAVPHVIGSNVPEVIVKYLNNMDALISRGGEINEWFLEKAAKSGIKVIGKTAVGLDSVDLSAATRIGIPIVYTPGANARSVAEYAVTCMLVMQKKVLDNDRQVRNGNYQFRFDYKSQEFSGKNVYLIGFGNIGREVAKMCTGLSMHVAIYDKYVSRKTIETQGYTYINDMYSGFIDADFISLHIPLTPETENIIDAKAFDMMKPTAYLINTARGGLVDEQELVSRLESDQLAGAAVDAIATEPNVCDSPLVRSDKVILSPHIAAQTSEAMFRSAKDCVDGIIAVLRGQKWPKVGNSDVYDRPEWR